MIPFAPILEEENYDNVIVNKIEEDGKEEENKEDKGEENKEKQKKKTQEKARRVLQMIVTVLLHTCVLPCFDNLVHRARFPGRQEPPKPSPAPAAAVAADDSKLSVAPVIKFKSLLEALQYHWGHAAVESIAVPAYRSVGFAIICLGIRTTYMKRIKEEDCNDPSIIVIATVIHPLSLSLSLFLLFWTRLPPRAGWSLACTPLLFLRLPFSLRLLPLVAVRPLQRTRRRARHRGRLRWFLRAPRRGGRAFWSGVAWLLSSALWSRA